MPTQIQQSLEHHTFGIEYKGVLSNGAYRILIGNRVGMRLSQITFSSFASIEVSHHGRKNVLILVNLLWRGMGVGRLHRDVDPANQTSYFSRAQ